jgi:DNA invertase Pin-like site-specific DNA recombinase
MDLIYLNRISTDNKDQDPTSNLNKCEDWAKYEEHIIKYNLIDKGVSGSVPYYEREEAKKIKEIALEYKKKNKPLGVLVFSIDRFSREHPVRALVNIEDLREMGVTIFSATENIFNEDSEFALPMQFIILWFNYYFLIQHSKKVKAGMRKKKLEGKGRGLLKEVRGRGKNKKYIYYNEEELKVIHDKIKKLIKKNSYREIVKLLEKENIKVSITYISKVMNE